MSASTPTFRLLYPFLHLLARGLTRLLAPRFRVSGRHNLPYRGPFLLTPNHISDADPPLVGIAMRRHPWFMAKAELWDIGWLGPVISWLQSFPVDPKTPDRAALKRAAQLLEAGEVVVVFPEGRVAPTGKMGEFMPGAALLALKSGVPVVPVGIWGAQHLIPYGEIRFHFTLQPVRLHFGKPLDFSDLAAQSGRGARVAATQRLETAIREAVEVAKFR